MRQKRDQYRLAQFRKNHEGSRKGQALTCRGCACQSEPKSAAQSSCRTPWNFCPRLHRWRWDSAFPPAPLSSSPLGWLHSQPSISPFSGEKVKQVPLLLEEGDLRFQYLTHWKFENTFIFNNLSGYRTLLTFWRNVWSSSFQHSSCCEVRCCFSNSLFLESF